MSLPFPTRHPISEIGTDGVSSITQLLDWKELIPLSQVNHLFYNALKRPISYYQIPFPSFHQTEFNIVAYEKWQQVRQPWIMTPIQLMTYSRSLVISHHADIILHIDHCQTYSNSYLHKSPSSPQHQLDELRSAVKRFTNVRSFKILFHPHPNSFGTQCHHPSDIPRPTWQLVLVQVCLEEWGAGLISFELEIHPKFECTLPKELITSRLHHLSSLQHFGLYLPAFFNLSQFYDPFVLASRLRFASDEIGVLVFSGNAIQSERTEDGRMVRQFLPTNASHCIWKNHSSKHVFEYLDQTNQNLTMPPPTFLEHQPYLVEPTVPFTRSQLCDLAIDASHLKFHPLFGEYRFGIMHEQLQMMVDNFILSPSSHGLQSLTLHDLFPRPQVDPNGVTSKAMDYRPYLNQLRPHLRRLHFSSDHRPTRMGSDRIKVLLQPVIPFDLVESEADGDENVWPQLESLNLSFPGWDTINFVGFPPFDQETWLALGRTLPKVHTLRISGLLLALYQPWHQPYVGLLANIRHLTLHLRDPGYSWNRCLQTVGYHVRTIILQMPQLESLELCSRPDPSWDAEVVRSYLWENLLPILLSTEHLRLVKCDYLFQPTTADQDELIDTVHESNVLFCYVIWKYLQPSFTMPVDYTNMYELLSPLFYPTASSDSRRQLAYQSLRRPEPISSPKPRTLFKRIDRKLSEWKLRWREWRHDHDPHWHQQHRQLERERRINARLIQLKQIQDDLDQRLNQLIESIRPHIPDHSIVPRPFFTLQLVPRYQI